MRGTAAALSVAALLLAGPCGQAGAEEDTTIADVISATYPEYSVSPPTPASAYICHGFGCRYRVEVAFGSGDRSTLANFLKAGKASPAAERAAIGKAGAWFDKRVAPSAGTVNHVTRAGMKYMNDVGQYDCIDSSRNTTSLLLILEQLKLLHHHYVDVPVARGYVLDFVTPHVTAVLTEKKTGKKWSVDSWTRGYAQAPEIMPLSVWLTLN